MIRLLLIVTCAVVVWLVTWPRCPQRVSVANTYTSATNYSWLSWTEDPITGEKTFQAICTAGGMSWPARDGWCNITDAPRVQESRKE